MYMALGRLAQIGLNPEKKIGWVGLAEPGWFELRRVARNWDESHLNTFCSEPMRHHLQPMAQNSNAVAGWLAGCLAGWR